MFYSDQTLPVREVVATSHEAAIAAYSQPGTWLDAETRTAILEEVRHAQNCPLCKQQKAALSPYAIDGVHDSVTNFPDNIVEVIHRICTDSGRLTGKWFGKVVESGDCTCRAGCRHRQSH